MKDIFVLIKRDLINSFKKRHIIILLFLILFQLWFILGSDSLRQVRTTGVMHYMAVVFSFNFFGTIVASTLNYYGLSIERESKLLDLILTSGISKKKVYVSKVLSSLLVSGIFSLIYILALMLIYLVILRDIAISLLTLRYILPLTAFISIFSLMGLMLSVIFRSSKASLVASLIIGGLLMPRLFIVIVDALSDLFGFSETVSQIFYLISPALIMDALSGYSEISNIFWGLFFFAVYLITNILLGSYIFDRQDELNYGE